MSAQEQFQTAALVNEVPGQPGVLPTEAVPIGVLPVRRFPVSELGGLRMTAPPAPDVDQQLVERVQKGDKRAFDLLVIKYQHKVMAVISRLIRDHAEAQDVAQEAFIKAYRALPNFRGDSAFYTWIYRIAINTAKNHIVARNRRPPSSDLDVEDAEFYPGNDAIHEMNTPERNLLRDELQVTIDQAFQDLPADLRTAVTLREIEGLSYEEIAEVMECPVGTVRSRIFRAREAIDRRIKPLVEDI
jgi:RNA polymerase sigma-70 factor (ECF subfamily)